MPQHPFSVSNPWLFFHDPQQADSVGGHQCGRTGVSQNRNPQAGQPHQGGDQEHGFQTQSDSNVLADNLTGGPRQRL